MTFLVKFSGSNGSHMGGVHHPPLADLEAGALPMSCSWKQSIFYVSLQPGQGAGINHEMTSHSPAIIRSSWRATRPGHRARQTGAFPLAFYWDSLVALWGFVASFFASYCPETLPVKPQGDIKEGRLGWQPAVATRCACEHRRKSQFSRSSLLTKWSPLFHGAQQATAGG